MNTLEIWLIRHGETEWSRSGRHTGSTDVSLTEHGIQQARSLASALAAQTFDRVFTSPMGRAIATCREAGLGDDASIEPDLHEWNYGDYEGRTTADIRQSVPDWTVWNAPTPNGETLAQIQRRANALIDRLLALNAGRIVLFSHGHFLRVLAGCWMTGQASMGAHLLLDTATISVLGYERESRVLKRWNLSPGSA
ncbi:MAG TPA: histidine phosphatase family protein [Dyella sp.]|uniref:histidine phosphatase family protein n=1 Tax=Dyella sp. TaxID=1869338 RepID=UPI002F93CB5F